MEIYSLIFFVLVVQVTFFPADKPSSKHFFNDTGLCDKVKRKNDFCYGLDVVCPLQNSC
jgi:hypothetical protein